MLFEPNETPYDLRFRIFRVPVRVNPYFWLMAVVITGIPRGGGVWTIPSILVGIAAVFVSVLIHEMGHILVGRVFGSNGYIVLYGFGGLAVGSNNLYRRWQRILVSLAGPVAQLLILVGVILVLWALPSPLEADLDLADQLDPLVFVSLKLAGTHRLLQILVLHLIFINLFWPLLNLLPIWPLDGGMITREVLGGLMPDSGVRVSLGISLVVAGLCAANAIAEMSGKTLIPVIGPLIGGGLLMVLLFGSLALGSWQALQALEAERRWTEDHWER